MSKASKMIVITGLPASGKTTISRKISKELGIPCFSKDEIKEEMYDLLDWNDSKQPNEVNSIGVRLLYYIMKVMAKSNQSLIVEGNFKPEVENKYFEFISKKYNIKFLQIICYAKGELLVNRFLSRINTNERHLGHCDKVGFSTYKAVLLAGGKFPLTIAGGGLLEIDTTKFEDVNMADIFNQVSKFLNKKFEK